MTGFAKAQDMVSCDGTYLLCGKQIFTLSLWIMRPAKTPFAVAPDQFDAFKTLSVAC
jgi:hypothetical protein